MTLQDLDSILKTATPEVFELAAPEGLANFVVYGRTGFAGVKGDDSILLDVERIQIDIVTQSTSCELEAKVFQALQEAHLPYSVIDVGYNPDRNWYYTRLQLVVV